MIACEQALVGDRQRAERGKTKEGVLALCYLHSLSFDKRSSSY